MTDVTEKDENNNAKWGAELKPPEAMEAPVFVYGTLQCEVLELIINNYFQFFQR